MNEFFTTSLSAYSKWILIRLIVDETIEGKLSKADLIKLGCPHNKFKKVVDELIKFNAILLDNVEHIKKGRPSDSYIFVYDRYTEINKLLPRETLAKIEGIGFRVPVKIVWCFFCLNKNEFGFVENLSVPVIAKACKLKNVEVQSAISKLVELNFIQHVIKGCTFKKVEIIGSKHKRTLIGTEGNNLKRTSCFKIIDKNQYKFLYLFTLPLIAHLDSHSRRKKIYSLTGALFPKSLNYLASL
tara:strand:+ start:1399 stop:2124 length:726 start_codon:yes stop_codon:yes gene_type:complete